MKFFKSVPGLILLAVILGVFVGQLFDQGELKKISDAGKLIIHWVKIVAGPFLFFTIIHSVVEVQIKWRHGLKLLAIALFNMGCAIAIGISLAHLFLFSIDRNSLPAAFSQLNNSLPQLTYSEWIKSIMPKSMVEPLVNNDVLFIAVLALLTGLALRKLLTQIEFAASQPRVLKALELLRMVPGTILTWLIRIIPLAVFAVIAGSVNEYGIGIFSSLGRYVLTVWLGFIIQVVVVYAFWIFIVAKLKPRRFFSAAKEPILYSLGVNSSLATLPLTLKSLTQLGVSKRSASLGAGVATNINNDGIILYEAMAIFFIAHLHGVDMTTAMMVSAVLSCIVATLGISGIPEAGFISLSVVVTSMGLPIETLPILLAVDWVVARGRSAVNVLSDMTLSIALDAVEPKEQN
jgi:Na+/H+-dicarboxylate symporter